MMERKNLPGPWYFLMAILAMFYLQNHVYGSPRAESISYSETIHLLESRQLAAGEVNEPCIRGLLKSARPGGSRNMVMARMYTRLSSLPAQYNAEYKGIRESHLLTKLLSWTMPMVVSSPSGFLSCRA
jgi:hypothetical protein